MLWVFKGCCNGIKEMWLCYGIKGVWLCYGYLRDVVMLWEIKGLGYVMGN